MFLFESLAQRSLMSDESLLQARDGYTPASPTLSAEQAFAHWTMRTTVQSELEVARELAGLPEERLAELAGVFARSTRRLRTDNLRHALPVGVPLVGAGVLGLLLQWGLLSPDPSGMSVLQMLSIGLLVSGLAALGVAALASFNMMPLDVAHGKVGLCVGLLDEQHPWLYKVSHLTRERPANAYRQRVLAERGPLRGVDYLMMREISRAYQAIEATQVARLVAERLQRPDATPTTGLRPRETRLFSVSTDAMDMAQMREPAEDEPVSAGSIRPFGPASTDRRRPG